MYLFYFYSLHKPFFSELPTPGFKELNKLAMTPKTSLGQKQAPNFSRKAY